MSGQAYFNDFVRDQAALLRKQIEEIEVLYRRHDGDFKAIAKDLGVCESTLKNRLEKGRFHGFTDIVARKPFDKTASSERAQHILALSEAGVSNANLARQFGVTSPRIRQLISKARIDRRRTAGEYDR